MLKHRHLYSNEYLVTILMDNDIFMGFKDLESYLLNG